MGYKPSVVEQAKSDYSPFGKALIRDLQKKTKRKNFWSVKNIGNKNEELLKEIKNQRTKESDKKDSKTAKIRNYLVYDQNHNFYKHGLDKFVEIPSIESKFDIFGTFYKDFISSKSLEVKTKKNTDHKFVVLGNATNEYNKFIKEYKKVYKREPKDDKSNGWEQKYDPKNLKALDYQPVKIETKLFSDENKADIKQPMYKALWFKINKKEAEELTGDIYNNQDNNNFKIIINKKTYDLKNAKKFWMEVITNKIRKSEAKKL